MILATLQQIVYSLLEKRQGGGGGGGVTLNVSNNYHPSRFLSGMAQFSVYEVSHERISKR